MARGGAEDVPEASACACKRVGEKGYRRRPEPADDKAVVRRRSSGDISTRIGRWEGRLSEYTAEDDGTVSRCGDRCR